MKMVVRTAIHDVCLNVDTLPWDVPKVSYELDWTTGQKMEGAAVTLYEVRFFCRGMTHFCFYDISYDRIISDEDN